MSAASPAATVYLVDDDASHLYLLAEYLQSDGHRVESFSSPWKFLQQYQPCEFGCLVTDYRMPGMSGLDLLRELAHRDAWLPTIMLSGYGDVSVCVRALKAGVVEFLEKPVRQAPLLQVVRNTMEQHALAFRNRLEMLARMKRLRELTSREREVMQGLIAGRSMKEIAADLGTSIQSVAKQRQRMLDKLGVRNDVEVAHFVFAIESSKWRRESPSAHTPGLIQSE